MSLSETLMKGTTCNYEQAINHSNPIKNNFKKVTFTVTIQYTMEHYLTMQLISEEKINVHHSLEEIVSPHSLIYSIWT